MSDPGEADTARSVDQFLMGSERTATLMRSCPAFPVAHGGKE